MKSSVKHVAGPFVGLLVLVTLVAGCSTAGAPAAEPSGTATPSASAAASSEAPTEVTTAEPAPTAEVAVFASGDTISAEDAEALPKGQYAYPMPDATLVVVTSAEPLPEAVRAVSQATVDTVIDDPGTPDNVTTNRAEIVRAAQEFASHLGAQTGKQIVVIFPLVGGCPGDTVAYLGWAHTVISYTDNFDCLVLPTRGEVEERVAASVAIQNSPELYQVFIHE